MMTDTADGAPSGTVVWSFPTARGAARAIGALRSAGFGAESIGVLAHNVGEEHEVARATQARPIEAVQTGSVTGRLLGGGGGLMVGLAAAVLPGVGPLAGVAAMVVTGLAGAGVGGVAGGLLGALGAVGVPEHEARRFRERFMQGDILVVVDAGNRQREAQQILVREGASNG